eukprot:11177996-Lingulodinium_polyedra.AAC.1
MSKPASAPAVATLFSHLPVACYSSPVKSSLVFLPWSNIIGNNNSSRISCAKSSACAHSKS